MGLKSPFRKLPVAKKVAREQGLLGLIIVSLQFVQKRTRRHNTRPQKPIMKSIRYEDLLDSYIGEPFKEHSVPAGQKLEINWLMPPPGKGSGGHMTLFRFIK